MELSRRNLLGGLIAISAPAIIPYSGLMPVRTIHPDTVFYAGINQRAFFRWAALPGNELVFDRGKIHGIHLTGTNPLPTSDAFVSLRILRDPWGRLSFKTQGNLDVKFDIMTDAGHNIYGTTIGPG